MTQQILILGANGQVGTRLQQQLPKAGFTVTALTRAELDFATADAAQIDTILRATKPALIINAAAYTQVDKAEQEKELAHRLNAEMPALLAEAAAEYGIPLIHFSTDYVFDGARGRYREEDAPRPLSVYGASKLAGETAVLEQGGTVFRLQWVYDTRGSNFLKTMQRLMQEREELTIVADQIGAPTAAKNIAHAITEIVPQLLAGTFQAGLYHMTAQGVTSWHGFACAIAQLTGRSTKLVPITTAEYPLPATRPRDGRLYCHKLAEQGITLPHWRNALAALLAENT